MIAAMLALALLVLTAAPDGDHERTVLTFNLTGLMVNELIGEAEHTVGDHASVFGETTLMFAHAPAPPGMPKTPERIGLVVGTGARWYPFGAAPRGLFVDAALEGLYARFAKGAHDVDGTALALSGRAGYRLALSRALLVMIAAGPRATFGSVTASDVNPAGWGVEPNVWLAVSGAVPFVDADAFELAVPAEPMTGALGLSLRTTEDVAFWAHVAAQYGHLADHALRHHDVGFPLAWQFSSMTLWGLGITPLRIAAQLLDAGPLVWVPLDGALLAALLVTHVIAPLDSPGGIHDAWARGDDALALSSSPAGYAADAVLFTLIGALATHLAGETFEGVWYGFTWKRHRVVDVDASGGTLALRW